MKRGPRLNVDVLSGLLFVALGLGFLWLATELPSGPPRRLGPGSFPKLVASLTVLVGVLVAISGLFRRDGVALSLHWTKLATIIAALIAFALLLRGAGLVPAALALVLIASLAHPALGWRSALALGLGLGIFSAALFSGLLGMPVAPLGTWLGG